VLLGGRSILYSKPHYALYSVCLSVLDSEENRTKFELARRYYINSSVTTRSTRWTYRVTTQDQRSRQSASATLWDVHQRSNYKILKHRAGFSWWEAWAQWRIWDFRKGLTIELQSFKNWGVWRETPCWWEAWGRAPPKSGPAEAQDPEALTITLTGGFSQDQYKRNILH